METCQYTKDQEKANLKKKEKQMQEKKIIDKIENIRKKNNKLWMNILRIAMDKKPNETKKNLSDITKNDTEISKLTKELSET
jgi:hypothetical protein